MRTKGDKKINMEQYTVRNIRNLLGLTQEKMAEKLGLGCSAYRKKEVGKTPWTHEEISKLLMFSGYTFEQIKFI